LISQNTLDILKKKKSKAELKNIEVREFIDNNTLLCLKQEFNYDGLIYKFDVFNFDELPAYKKKRAPRATKIDDVENLFG
jgi:hypothetical protein